jgi:hypothetical protein
MQNRHGNTRNKFNELLDFGAGRKLERRGAFTVHRPGRMARDKAAALPWAADDLNAGGVIEVTAECGKPATIGQKEL